MKHELKTDPKPWGEIATGRKLFEFRHNDRNYSVGDTLLLRKTKYSYLEMSTGQRPLEYTGEELEVEVTYIMDDAQGNAVMSIKPVDAQSHCVDPLQVVLRIRDAHPEFYSRFSTGSCYQLFQILKEIFKDAVPLYSNIDGHWITRIGDRYFDIGGEILKEYVVKENGYEEQPPEAQKAAAVAFGDRGIRYDKYLRTE